MSRQRLVMTLFYPFLFSSHAFTLFRHFREPFVSNVLLAKSCLPLPHRHRRRRCRPEQKQKDTKAGLQAQQTSLVKTDFREYSRRHFTHSSNIIETLARTHVLYILRVTSPSRYLVPACTNAWPFCEAC